MSMRLTTRQRAAEALMERYLIRSLEDCRSNAFDEHEPLAREVTAAAVVLATLSAKQHGSYDESDESYEARFLAAVASGDQEALQVADAARDVLRAARQSHRSTAYAAYRAEPEIGCA